MIADELSNMINSCCEMKKRLPQIPLPVLLINTELSDSDADEICDFLSDAGAITFSGVTDRIFISDADSMQIRDMFCLAQGRFEKFSGCVFVRCPSEQWGDSLKTLISEVRNNDCFCVIYGVRSKKRFEKISDRISPLCRFESLYILPNREKIVKMAESLMPRPLLLGTEKEFVNTAAKWLEKNAGDIPLDLAAEEIVYQMLKNSANPSIEMLLTESRFFTVMSKKKQAIGFDAR